MVKGKRSKRKKIEKSILEQIKKFGERLTFSDLLAITTGIYGGYALKHPYGFLLGSIGYKLAIESRSNLAAGAGLGTLAILGLSGIPSEVWETLYIESLPEYPEWWPFRYPKDWPKYR